MPTENHERSDLKQKAREELESCRLAKTAAQ
jgi:hypothetical protein